MQKMPRNTRLNLVIFTLVSLIIVASDYITKILTVKNVALNDSITVIKNVLNFTYIRNRGAAFGILSNHRWVFMIISVFLIAFIIGYIIYNKSLKLQYAIALALVAGGGIGNMIDRIFYGYVIDYIDFVLFPFWRWIFNIADASVCIGAGLLVLLMVIDEIKETKKDKIDDNRIES